MTTKTVIEQSTWSVKINTQPLYSKLVDGRTILRKMTEEENEKVEQVVNRAIAEAKGVLAWGESKRESLASRRKEDNEETTEDSNQSIWTVRINSQLLYKKALNGRTILFGMNEGDYNKVANIMDNAIAELAEILKDKTQMREIEVEEKEQLTVADATKYETDMKIEEAKFQLRKELEEKAKKKEIKDEPLHEKIHEATKNEIREEIQNKKKSDSKSSFWDNLK